MLSNLRGKYLRGVITFSAGVLGGFVTQPSSLNAIGNPSPSFLGLTIALWNIGCLLGCVIASLVSDTWGRRKIIIWGCIIMIVGGIVQLATYGAAQLIVEILISGVGSGTYEYSWQLASHRLH
ncbi:sugar transporter stl1 [Fusarium sporotrichioides]|uniref:Sugar transporter stl1 n=1 Tax=Fusarium sporotrichioides TaxID=5514 RepID=A0A395S808_FUSSP|nr:sugar transporter stl1 [Fusarium sporotrichioides]